MRNSPPEPSALVGSLNTSFTLIVQVQFLLVPFASCCPTAFFFLLPWLWYNGRRHKVQLIQSEGGSFIREKLLILLRRGLPERWICNFEKNTKGFRTLPLWYQRKASASSPVFGAFPFCRVAQTVYFFSITTSLVLFGSLLVIASSWLR